MTAATVELGGRSVVGRVRWAPEEGWASVVLAALLAWAVGWAIDDPAWVIGREEWTDFLPWAGVAGVAVGFAGAKLAWPRWIAHLGGAIAAALVLPVVIGTIIVGERAGVGDPAGIVEMYRATADATWNAWYDLAILGSARTPQFGHYLLGLGILCWGTGQFAAYAVFGHRRPLDAIVCVGLVLLGNMSLTIRDQLGQLILFSLVGLALLARAHAFEEQTAWLRRRIGDPAAVRSLYLRGGTVFIVGAVIGSMLLTSAASSAPLAGLWSDSSGFLIELSRRLERLLPLGGASRPIGVMFGSSTVISGFWQQDNKPALTITLPAGEAEDFYWRAVAYDTVTLNGWEMSDQREVVRVAGDPLLDGLFDDPATAGHREVTFDVVRNNYFGPQIVSPLTPVAASLGASVTSLGTAGHLGAIALDGNPRTFEITALVPIYDEDDPNGLTQNRLRAAGQDYPAALDPYLVVPDGVIGPDSQLLLAEILERTRAENPYDLATGMESFFRSRTNFTYDTNVQDVNCGGLSTAECFARHRQGYCQYYATTMAVLLRYSGIPARMVEGFLPGDRDGNVVTILNSGAHAWVEVWFPGYGWQKFDPTGGGLARDTPIPSGAPVSPGPSISIPPASGIDDGTDIGPPTRDPNVAPLPTDGGGSDSPLAYVVITILLAVVVGGLAFIAWQRGPRGETGPDQIWRGIGRIAARFGFAPRPTQTVYEYAGALGDVLPGSRPELETVARAKVEVAYGRGVLSDERLRALRDAHRRLRVSLLRLAFRRRERRAHRRR
jgi:transglutaminase-like putative cysteine protease